MLLLLTLANGHSPSKMAVPAASALKNGIISYIAKMQEL